MRTIILRPFNSKQTLNNLVAIQLLSFLFLYYSEKKRTNFYSFFTLSSIIIGTFRWKLIWWKLLLSYLPRLEIFMPNATHLANHKYGIGVEGAIFFRLPQPVELYKFAGEIMYENYNSIWHIFLCMQRQGIPYRKSFDQNYKVQ